jgi:Uma2 family endonuclease
MSTAVTIDYAPATRKRPLYRLSVEQYEKMIKAGVLKSGAPVELIEGLLLEKMTQHPPHAATADCTQEVLRPLLPEAWRLREQKPIKLSDSEPEPDLAAVRGPLSRYARRHPRPPDIGLLIEVADTSLDEDRVNKGRVYTRARIPIYWIINLVDTQVEVYSQPKAGRNPTYRDCQIYGIGDTLPVVIAGQEVARVAVRELFPSLSPGELK